MGERRLKDSIKAAKVQCASKKITGHVCLYSVAPSQTAIPCTFYHEQQSKQTSWSLCSFSKKTQAERHVMWSTGKVSGILVFQRQASMILATARDTCDLPLTLPPQNKWYLAETMPTGGAGGKVPCPHPPDCRLFIGRESWVTAITPRSTFLSWLIHSFYGANPFADILRSTARNDLLFSSFFFAVEYACSTPTQPPWGAVWQTDWQLGPVLPSLRTQSPKWHPQGLSIA